MSPIRAADTQYGKVCCSECWPDVRLTNGPSRGLWGGKTSHIRLGRCRYPATSTQSTGFSGPPTIRRCWPKPKSEREAFAGVLAIMRDVAVPFGAPYGDFGICDTEYRTVTDLTNRIYFFALTTSPNVIWVQMNALNLATGSPPLVIDPRRFARRRCHGSFHAPRDGVLVADPPTRRVRPQRQTRPDAQPPPQSYPT